MGAETTLEREAPPERRPAPPGPEPAALASVIGNRAMGRLLSRRPASMRPAGPPPRISGDVERNGVRALQRAAKSRVLARTSCAIPSHCPSAFCAALPRIAAEFSRQQLATTMLAGIATMVSPRVVGIWSDYIFGGSPPRNLTSQFGHDFETSVTTLHTTNFLLVSVLSALRASPPTFPAGTSTVTIPLATLIPAALRAIDTPGNRNEMNFNQPGEIPGNLAGGIGKNEAACRFGAQPSPFDDERRAAGTVTVTTDGAGHLTIDTVINYTVKDTVDLCPGDCGAPAERLATVPMSQWEASGISGDIPFTVDFTVRGRTLHLTVPPPPPAPPAPPPTHLHTVPAEALFDFDSDRLRPDAATAIETELGTAPSRADLTRPVVVVGHTDSIPGPDPAYNQRLSERRAEAVKALLERRYPNLRGHVVAVGRGDTQPIAPNRLNGHDNPAGRARNRRVDIELQEVLPGAGP